MSKSLQVLIASIIGLILVEVGTAGPTSYIGQATQPVSGTVTVQQGTASSLKVDLSGTAQNSTAIKVDGSGFTQPVSGSFSANGSTVAIVGLNNSPNIPVVLQAGTAAAGQVSLAVKDSAGTVTSVGYNTGASSIPVSLPISNIGAQTSGSVTGSTGQLLAANGNRKGLECDALCANTQTVYISLGTASATTAMKQLPPCTSWSPPSTVMYQGALQAISASGTQTVICVEY